MKKKTKNKYLILHDFYSKLEKLISDLERKTARKLEVQINIKK